MTMYWRGTGVAIRGEKKGRGVRVAGVEGGEAGEIGGNYTKLRNILQSKEAQRGVSQQK